MAKRIIEIEGRLASTDLGLNLGPSLLNAIKPNATNQSINWTSEWTGVGVNTSFLLMTEAWVYPSSTSTLTVYRNRNSGAGVQDSLAVTTLGSISWNFDIGGNFGPFHFDVTLPNNTIPNNQWLHILHASDLTSPVSGSRIIEHTLNGILVPASSRSLSQSNNNQNGWANPHADTHNLFLTSSPSAASRYWMIQDFLDITDTANVDKFIDRVNYRPIQLGPDGSTPTGNVPVLFMQNTILNITENLGGERNADSITGIWEDAGHNPSSPAHFAHQTALNPNQSGLELPGATLGLVDTQQFSLSMWFKTASTITAGTLVYCSDTSGSKRLVIEYNSSGLINITAADSTGSAILDADATLDDISDNTWHHLAISINMQAAVAADAVRIFIDDVDAVPAVTTFTQGGNINLGQTGLLFAILNTTSLAALTNGEFSQFWCAPGIFVDFAIGSVRSKYVQTTTVPIPIDLGDTGEIPLGASPLIFTGEGPTFVDGSPFHNLNRGSAGGTFTVSRGAWISPSSNPAVDQLGN